MNWLKRRWQEFRWGHHTYLSFLLSFTSFMLITYRLFIEKIYFLHDKIPTLKIYALMFFVLYIPISIIIGFVHKTKVLKSDTDQCNKQNPQLQEILRKLNKIERKMK